MFSSDQGLKKISMSQGDTTFSEKKCMGWMLLSFLSVVLFCFSARGLIGALGEARHFSLHTHYSRLAIRIEKYYKVLAWAALTLFVFSSMLSSFIQSFSEVIR